MSIRKFIARFLIIHCKLKNLHGGTLQKITKSLLDEIDLQHFRERNTCPMVASRDESFSFVYSKRCSPDPVTYLEFGVYNSESMRKWIALSKDDRSRFYGFDSFEGLPEAWNAEKGKGYFDAGGKAPEIGDNRVTFIKGWFEKTVPNFVMDFSPQHRLIIHLDADLYASTIIPLVYLDRFITAGTVLIFDEFYDRDHEFKAFKDYMEISRKKFQALCQVDDFAKVSIEML